MSDRGKSSEKRDFHNGSPLKIGGYSLLNALKLFRFGISIFCVEYSIWNIIILSGMLYAF